MCIYFVCLCGCECVCVFVCVYVCVCVYKPFSFVCQDEGVSRLAAEGECESPCASHTGSFVHCGGGVDDLCVCVGVWVCMCERVGERGSERESV